MLSTNAHVLTSTVVVLSAGRSPYLTAVLQGVLRCRPRPSAVRLIWSGASRPALLLPSQVNLVRIAPSEFDHGGTRQLALEMCDTEVVVFLSDDAEPISDAWLRNLVDPLRDIRLAAVYGRQVAREGADPAEAAFRAVRYPSTSAVYGASEMRDGAALGLPISNANAGYRVDHLRRVGGFPRKCAFGEDRIVVQQLLNADLRICYSPSAAVWHSHKLTLIDTVKRGYHTGRLARNGVVGTANQGPALETQGLDLTRRMVARARAEFGLRGVTSVGVAIVARGFGYAAGRWFSRGGRDARVTGDD